MKKKPTFTPQQAYELRNAAKAFEQAAREMQQCQRTIGRGVEVLVDFKQDTASFSTMLQQSKLFEEKLLAASASILSSLPTTPARSARYAVSDVRPDLEESPWTLARFIWVFGGAALMGLVIWFARYVAQFDPPW